MGSGIDVPVMEPEEKVGFRMLPPYHVIIENDDHHSMQFVVGVLRDVFKYDVPRAYQIMIHAHEHGEAIAWTGSKEVAELKLDQIQTFHERHPVSGDDMGPLGSRIEPAN